METIKRKTSQWWPAWLAALRYITYSALLAYHTWHVAVKDIWNQLTSWDQINVACSVGLNVLLALGAIMNGSWQKAKANDNTSTNIK